MLHGELSDGCNAFGALLGDIVEMPANGCTLDALAGDFGKTDGSFYESLANVVAQTETWKARMDLWIKKNRDVVTTLAPRSRDLRHSLQSAHSTVRGRTVKTCARCWAKRCKFFTDNVSHAPQELISNFQTLVEDQVHKFIVFQLSHAAQAMVDLVWISKFVQETLLAFLHCSVGH